MKYLNREDLKNINYRLLARQSPQEIQRMRHDPAVQSRAAAEILMANGHDRVHKYLTYAFHLDESHEMGVAALREAWRMPAKGERKPQLDVSLVVAHELLAYVTTETPNFQRYDNLKKIAESRFLQIGF